MVLSFFFSAIVIAILAAKGAGTNSHHVSSNVNHHSSRTAGIAGSGTKIRKKGIHPTTAPTTTTKTSKTVGRNSVFMSSAATTSMKTKTTTAATHPKSKSRNNKTAEDIDTHRPISYFDQQYPAPSTGILTEHIEFKKAALEKVCGIPAASALIEYAKFHARVLEGKEPQRYLTSVAVESGLTDRSTGIVSLFWLAFMSRSAFQIESYPTIPRFEAAYDYVFINWTRNPLPDESKYTEPVRFARYTDIPNPPADKDFIDGRLRRYNPNEVDTNKYHMDYIVNNMQKACAIYHHSDMTMYPGKGKEYPNEQYMFVSSNRGGIHCMFSSNKDKPHFQLFTNKLLLTKENAFRCAHHFLFQENRRVRDVMSKYTSILSPSSQFSNLKGKTEEVGTETMVTMMPEHTLSYGHGVYDTSRDSNISILHNNTIKPLSALKIGIAIRVGDHTLFNRDLDNNKTSSSSFDHYLRCARHLPSTLLSSFYSQFQSTPLPIIWYIMSDSLKLRQSLYQQYSNGTKDLMVLVDHDTAHNHGVCNIAHKYTQNHTALTNMTEIEELRQKNCKQQSLDHSIIYAVADLLLFSLCDVHIVSDNGFARFGAELSKPPRSVFMLYKEPTQNIQRVCNINTPTHHTLLASYGAGF